MLLHCIHSCIYFVTYHPIQHGTDDQHGAATCATFVGEWIGCFDLGPSWSSWGQQHIGYDTFIAQLGLGAQLLVALVLE